MNKLLLFLIPFGLWAQTPAAETLSFVNCPAAAKAGTTVNCSVNAATVGSSLAAIQGDASFSGVPSFTVTIGSSATAAMKQLSTAPVPGATRFLIFGLNQTPIANGDLVNFSFVMPNASVTGNIVNIVSSDPSGSAIPSTLSAVATVALLSNCDVNGDGSVTSADVTAEAQLVLAAPSGSAPDVTTLQKVVNASLDQPCTL